MKRKLCLLVAFTLLLIMMVPASVLANDGNNYMCNDLIGAEESEFEFLIKEIQNIKSAHPEYKEERILEILDEQHPRTKRGLIDIWNVLTDSEKRLCVRYPFDALKVNTAKNI